MFKIRDSLRKLLGRFIKAMQELFLATYSIYIPLGFLFTLVGIEKEGWVSWLFMGMGAVCIVVGVWAVVYAFKEYKKHQHDTQMQFHMIYQSMSAMSLLLEAIAKQLGVDTDSLKPEIRRMINERDNKE